MAEDTTPSQDDHRLNAAFDASKRGLIRGGLYGLIFGCTASLLLNRYSPSFRHLRMPIKSAFVSMTTFGGAAFASEHTIYRLTRPTVNQTSENRSSMNWYEWAVDHRLGIVASIISAVVLGTGYRMAQNKNTTGAQKFMNVRLYGQMAGLAAIVAIMGISAARSVTQNDKKQ